MQKIGKVKIAEGAQPFVVKNELENFRKVFG